MTMNRCDPVARRLTRFAAIVALCVLFPSVARAEATPVTAGCFAEATWTPIAFLQLVVGASAGSGWNIPIADGLRINEREGSHDAELTGGAFDGLVWSAKAGGAAQAERRGGLHGGPRASSFARCRIRGKVASRGPAGRRRVPSTDGGASLP